MDGGCVQQMRLRSGAYPNAFRHLAVDTVE